MPNVEIQMTEIDWNIKRLEQIELELAVERCKQHIIKLELKVELLKESIGSSQLTDVERLVQVNLIFGCLKQIQLEQERKEEQNREAENRFLRLANYLKAARIGVEELQLVSADLRTLSRAWNDFGESLIGSR